jgi:TP901 family phage tail tape measure protein
LAVYINGVEIGSSKVSSGGNAPAVWGDEGVGSAGAGGVSTGVGSITIDSPLAVYINGVEIGSSKVSSGGNASAVWGDEGVVLDNDSEDALKAADSIYNQKLGSYRGNLSSIAKLVRERNKLKTTSYSTGSEQEANRLSAIDLIQNQINDIARTAGRQVSGISSSDVRRSVEGLSSEFNEDRRSDRDRLAKNADEKAKAIDSAMVEAAKEYQRIQDEITTTLKKQLTIKEALAKLERSPEKNAKEIGDQKQLSQILDDRYKRLNAQAEKLGVSPSDKDRILTGAESERSYDYYESMARMDKARNGGLTKDDRVALSEYRQILKDQSSYQNEYLDIQKMLASDRRVNTDYRTRKSYQDRAAEVKQLWGEKTEDASLWESQYGEIVKNNPEMAKAVEGMMGDISDVNRRKSASRLTKENGAVTLFQNLKTSFHGLLNQFTQFGAAYKILGMVQTGIQNVVTAATNLDKAMTNIRIVTGDSREEAVKYMKSLSGLAGQLSVTTQEVASAADDWLRQGYSISDTNALITDSIHLSVLGLVSQGEATSDLTSIMKGYKLSVNEVATAVDKLTAVDMASASSAGGIAQALEQVANVANTAGVSLDQTIGMISTISDVTQREPSSVGQALRTMIARFSNVKAGVYGTMNVDSDNAEATENVNDIEKVLKKVGIQVRSSELDFRSFSDVLSDVADKWDTLDDVSKKAIATSVAGVRQSEQFYALMNNWDKYQKLTEVSANSAGTAEKKYLSYTEQLEAAQKRLQAAWESLAQNVDLNKFLTGLDNLFADAVKNLPIVLRYVLRFFATMQAYKIPTLLGSAKSFLFDAGGLIGGRGQRVRNYLGGSHGYDAQLQESKVGTIGGGLFDKTPTGQLIKALKENTAAQQGNTTATQQNTSVKNEGSLTAGLPQEPYNMSAPAGSKWDPALNNGKGGYRDIATGRMVPGQYDYAKAGYITNPEDALTDSGYIFIGDTKTGVGKYVTQKEDGSFVGVGPDAKTVEMSLKDKMQYERRVNKQTKGNSAAIAATVASGIVSAALTAQTSGQWENKILGTTEDREYSDDTKATIRGLTGIGAAAGGIAGALIAKSPTGAAVGSQLGGGLMDFLSNKIGPYLDRESFARKDLVEIGEKGLTVMANIKSSVTTLSDLADENLNSTNYESAVSARNNILKQLFSDGSDESRGVFENYLAQMGYSGTLYDMTGNYLTGTSADRKNLSNALTVAQRRTSSNEYMKSQAENIKEQQDALDKQWIGSGGRVDWETIAEPWSSGSLIGAMGRGTAEHLSGGAVGGTGADMWGTAKSMENLYRAAADKAGLSDKLNVHNYQTGWEEALNWLSAGNISQHETEIDTSAMSLNEKDDFYKSLLAEAQKEGNADLINSVSDILDNLKSIKEKQGQIYDEVNEQNVDAAVLTAGLKNSAGTTTTSITSMTTSQLKNLGIDKIRDMVAQELMANGGLAGHDIYIGEGNDRVMTDYAKNLIDSTLKQYSSIYGVVSGESYKLSEIFDLAEGTADEKATKLKIEEEFASAIGTTIDKLSDYASKYGDLTLGDFLSTPADLRTNLESYAKILNEIGSATGLTNETMESIISKYPDLIEYLGDTATLTTKLLGKMGQTSDLYSSGTMSSILGSSSVFDTLVSAIKAMGTGAGSLYDAVESDKVFGNASSLSDILTWLGSGSDLAKRVQEVINKVLNFNVDVKEDQTILNDVISYQTKMMDKQITNLNDQKEALSKINSQREYGNKLIEAQLKLEDAQKKKLVYREGVGFTYESDQAAIKEAQDALDELDVTKQQDLLQTEIDQLTSEKELLSDLANDSELKNLKEIYESWAKSNGVINTDQAKILTTITQLYNNFASLNVASAVSSGASTSAASASAAKEKMDTAWKNYQANSTSANLQAWQEAAKAYMNSGSGYSEDNMSEEQRTAYEKAIYSGKTYTFTDHDGKRHIATSTDPLLDSSDDGSNALKYAQSHDDVFVYSSAHKNGRSVSQLYSENYDSLSALLGALYKEEDGPLLLYADGKYIAYTGEQVLSTKVSDATGDTSSQFVYKAAALGSYGLPGGQTLLNEKGTEAIVTPYGTLTSLPSGTGVVPADLTQKLYDLSMVSPSILNALGAYKTGAGVAVSGIGGSSTDESLNINSLTMNVTAGSDFDADAFAEQLKQQAALTKRNH